METRGGVSSDHNEGYPIRPRHVLFRTLAVPADRSTAAPHRIALAPWLMLLGIVGMSLALLGLPAPVLTCLLLVGIGADADIARRALLFVQAGAERVAAPVRTVHALLYAALYYFAWGAMLHSANSDRAHLFLMFDLGASMLILAIRARRSLSC